MLAVHAGWRTGATMAAAEEQSRFAQLESFEHHSNFGQYACFEDVHCIVECTKYFNINYYYSLASSSS